MLVNGAALVFAPMLGGFILSFFSYRAIFLFLTLLSSLMLLGVITKVPKSLSLNLRRESSLIAVIKDYQSLITRKSFILPILIQGFTFAIFFSYMAASPFILQNIYQLNAQQYSYVFALTGFGLILNAQITARGKILNTKDLLDALNSGKVAAAALDTYENEAPYFPKDFSDKTVEDEVLLELIQREDVLVSQHIAFYTETAVMNLVEGGLDSAKQVIETGSCDNRVN